MVLERGALQAAVVNLDWICVEEDVVARLRKAINERTGIATDNITISATHTHSATNTLNFWGWGEVEKQYVEHAIPAIVNSVATALDNLKPSEVGFATCPSLTGVNRRGIKENGTLGFDADPCSVTNGSLSYSPTREARHRGGYETWVGKATSAYLLADDVDDHLVTENLRILRKAFGNSPCRS